MNFLAHYILASQIENPDFHTGAILPDIGRRAGFQLSKSVLPVEFPAQLELLMAGMDLHWFSDKHFHDSSFFWNGYNLWKDEIGFQISGVNRKFFLYHLLFEMWLDRILQEANPDAGNAMYASLQEADQDLIRLFSFEILGDPTHKIQATLTDFNQRKFVLDYAHDLKFSGIASGVFAHVTKQSQDPELRDLLSKSVIKMDRYSERILKDWEFFSEKLIQDWNQSRNSKS